MKLHTLYLLGRPFSPFYSLLMRFRETLYRTRILRVTRMAIPVISVGNLTMGGSGKTPIVQYIARFLQDNGRHPAVISRGYGGSARGRVNLVSDGRRVLLDAPVAGDEPRLLADTLPGVPVLTGRVRKYPAARAVELGADVLVLDDGFQHLALGRNIDLVLFNADFLAGNSRVFPGGDLREPVKALNRCDGFVLTGICPRNRQRAEQFADLLRQQFPTHPIFLAGYRPASLLYRDREGMVQSRPLEDLNGMKLFGFCGIAHPGNFSRTLAQLDVVVSGFKPFADHYLYNEADLKDIFQQAVRQGAGACITTEKDMIKLTAIKDGAVPLYALRMEVEFENDFKEFLLSRIGVL